MPAFFPLSCEYGLRSVLYLAKRAQDNLIQVNEIASALHIPRDFLSKILQRLTRRGIVRSRRGKNGGFGLGKAASKITINDIVEAIEGDQFLSQCVLGFPGCSDELACPVHSYWKETRTSIMKMLNDENIENLSKHIDGKLALLESMSN